MKITDELLYQHAAEARDIWLDTLPNEDELPEHQFSDEFMASLETMKKQEKGQSKKRKRTPPAAGRRSISGGSHRLRHMAECRCRGPGSICQLVP